MKPTEKLTKLKQAMKEYGVITLSYDAGIKEGAYKQLRGKCEVTYVIDKDSCIVDTIIKIK